MDFSTIICTIICTSFYILYYLVCMVALAHKGEGEGDLR